MHETLNSKYKGYIDEDVINNGIRKVTGWSLLADGSAFKAITKDNIKVVNKVTNVPLDVLEVDVCQRPDVANFYHINFLDTGFNLLFPALNGKFSVYIDEVETFELTYFDTRSVSEIIKLGKSKIPDLVVVDNFYADPDSVRAYALSQEFKHNEKYHKGARTERSYIPNWVGAEFGRLLGTEVTEFVGATGVFQYCVAKDNVVYHYDTQQYAAMVYLSPDAPLQTGTQTLKSKITGLMTAATDEDATRLGKSKEELDALSFNSNNFYDSHNFEIVDRVANVYNRLVIFNAQALHSATSYYGDTKENGRLFHLYFFNVKK